MSLFPWILAARPRTLPAAVMPVVVGSAIAGNVGGFQWIPATLCGLFAVLVQIGTNYANDYYDWKQGADSPHRIGPTRAVASGLLPPRVMRAGAFAALGLAFACGLFLVAWGGWWLVAVGVLSVLSGLAYTAKPVALGYRGLGDVFVIAFFGLIAVSVTTFVQTGTFPFLVWPAGLAVGLLANNLLVVNNYRDRESDMDAGKRTVVVRFGPQFGECLVLTSIAVSALLCLGLALLADQWTALIALPGLVPVYRVWRRMPRALRRDGFDRLLRKSAAGLIAYSLLLSVGLVLA
ncbi:MAG: 1,4-dihydroxy-2-naphthoate polyprenyltransferase [Puniceicoccaceae bacterium]